VFNTFSGFFILVKLNCCGSRVNDSVLKFPFQKGDFSNPGIRQQTLKAGRSDIPRFLPAQTGIHFEAVQKVQAGEWAH